MNKVDLNDLVWVFVSHEKGVHKQEYVGNRLVV